MKAFTSSVFAKVLTASGAIRSATLGSNPGHPQPSDKNPCQSIVKPDLLLQGTTMASCLYRQGRIYRDGLDGQTQNDVWATYYFREAALAGHFRGATDYAFQLMHGLGTERDLGMAFMIYQTMSEAPTHDPESQLQLARMYLSGSGVEKDPAAALAYFKLAAEKGNNAAQNELCQNFLNHCN